MYQPNAMEDCVYTLNADRSNTKDIRTHTLSSGWKLNVVKDIEDIAKQNASTTLKEMQKAGV